jgi:hypothetical protein
LTIIAVEQFAIMGNVFIATTTGLSLLSLLQRKVDRHRSIFLKFNIFLGEDQIHCVLIDAEGLVVVISIVAWR